MPIGAPLVDFIKEMENAPLSRGDCSAIRHPSPEGGLDTVGFGHKLVPAEVSEGKVYGYVIDDLTLDACSHILHLDLRHHINSLSRRIARLGAELSELSTRKQMMLLDYEFNLGNVVKIFPSFTQAVIDGDRARQEAEYIRTYKDADGIRRPLARNAHFYNTFMSDEAIARLGD